ncbi:hypothetical protein [Listeria sp. ILCC792]|uniref:hypothetical protein n=1 Tax=Listeria sp. ILCC792 TaxID=1918331 RepID=UPI000B5904E9|nr:hypothetical protein [Listeria sp. ILCC792]
MKKFIAITETDMGDNFHEIDYLNESWLLINAENEAEAIEIALENKQVLRVKAIDEVNVSDEKGVTHHFILNEGE